MSSVSEKLLRTRSAAISLRDGGYRVCKVGTEPEWRQDFDAELGLDTVELFAFIELTQGHEWAKLVKAHGGDEELRPPAGSSSVSPSRSTSAGRSMSSVTASAIRTSRSGSRTASLRSASRPSWSPTTTPTG